MSQQWFVYKDGQALGPFAAKEIRDSLREGAFDPFDLVSRVGSDVRRELVEVDEIFLADNEMARTSDDDYSRPSQPGYDHQESPQFAGNYTQSSLQNDHSQTGPGNLLLAADPRQTQKALQAAGKGVPARRQQLQSSSKKRDPRKFHLVDRKGSVLGPLAATEIKALYFRGVLDKSVKVMRDGSNARVNIGKFIQAYGNSALSKRPPAQASHPVMPPRSMRREVRMFPGQHAHMTAGPSRWTTVMVVVLGVILAGAAIALLINGPGARWLARDKVPAGEIRKAPKTAPRIRKQPPRKPVIHKSRRTIYSQKQRSAGKVAALQRRKSASTQSKSRAGTSASARRLTSPWASQQQVNRPIARDYPKPPTAVLAPKPVQQQPAPAKPAKPTGPSVATLTNGQTVSGLGPFSFSRSAVQACQGSCSVTFAGPPGTVTVAFFRDAWGNALLGKPGSVYINGIVKKNGADTKIILTGVR